MHKLLLFICFSLFLKTVITQKRNYNNYVITNNLDEPLFTISNENKSCVYQSFVGDGSSLTCSNNNTRTTISIIQISNLTTQVYDQISYLQNQVLAKLNLINNLTVTIAARYYIIFLSSVIIIINFYGIEYDTENAVTVSID